MIDNGGVRINWWTAKYRPMNRGRRLSEFDPDHYIEASYLTGRGTLIPVGAFHELGLYDDDYFQQCGDTELTLRAKAAGYKLYLSYRAVVKSYLESGNRLNVGQTYRLSDLKDYSFGIRSNLRLKYRYRFARAAAGKNWLRFGVYFLCDLARITVHFVRQLRFG